MDNKEQHDIDKCFQDRFGEMEVPKFNFGADKDQEEETRLDSIFQSKFEDYEEVPNEKIWDNIQKDLPLHLLWRRRLTQMSKVAAIFLLGLFLSLMVAEQSAALRGFVYQEKEEIPQVAPAPTITPSDFVFDVNTTGGDLEEESSKTLFEDDVVANENTDNDELNKALLEPVSPLPKLGLQEVTATGAIQAKEAATASMPRVGDKEGTGDIDKFDADIMARNNQVNPAQ